MDTATKIETLAKDELCADCSWWTKCMELTLDHFQIQHDSCFEKGEPFFVPT